MAAQSLGTLGDDVVLPLLDLGRSQRVLAGSLRCGGLALEDMDDEGGLRLAVQRLELPASASISIAGLPQPPSTCRVREVADSAVGGFDRRASTFLHILQYPSKPAKNPHIVVFSRMLDPRFTDSADRLR